MRRKFNFDRSRQGYGQLLLAVLLGATAGLFISGYWLIDLFPADSRLLILSSAVAALAVAVAYRVALTEVSPLPREVTTWRAMRLVAAAGLLACFLFFAGTTKWQEPGRYIGFLLPPQHFILTATGAEQGTSIVWINTSLGDVSFDSLASTGWIRRGDRMMLQDPLHNSMTWRDLAGEHIEIVFDSPEPGGDLMIRWGDRDESIHLSTGKASYERTFAVPFFASGPFVIGLGLLNFWLMSVLALFTLSSRFGGVGHPAIAPVTSQERNAAIRKELPVLAAIMGLALLLRIINLGAVFPAVDEYYHLIAADQILSGASFGSVYPRGLWIVTIPVALALRVLGHEVWVGRAIGVVFNVLALAPLYVLTRKISRPAAITVCLLYATSPWIITFSRVAREYAYYPLYFYLIIWVMISFVEVFPQGFVANLHWRGLLRPKVAILVLLLLVPPIFALRIDWLSTFRTILIAYLVLGLFILARFNWRARTNLPVLSVATILLVGAGWFFYREQITKLVVIPRINPVPLSYFFPNPQQQWYLDRVTFMVAISIAIAVVVALAIRRATIVPLFFVALFGAYLAVFTLFSKSFFHTRHLISTQFWYVVLVGIGLCWLWEWLRHAMPWKGRAAQTVLAAVLAALTLNPSQILLPTLSRDPDMPISEDYLHDMSALQPYMTANVRQGDALISTVYGLYAAWEGRPEFGEQFRINSGTTREEIESMIKVHPSGWLVIDAVRLDLSPLTERSLSSIPQMEYIGTFGDEHVWRWGLLPAE